MNDCLPDLHSVSVTISSVPQEERAIMTAVSEVIDLAGNEVTMSPWQGSTLADHQRPAIEEKSGGPKSSASPIVIDNEIENTLQLNRLLRSDPEVHPNAD